MLLEVEPCCYTIGLSVRSDMRDKLWGKCCSIKLVLVAVLVMGGVRHHPDHTSCSLSATGRGKDRGQSKWCTFGRIWAWREVGPADAPGRWGEWNKRKMILYKEKTLPFSLCFSGEYAIAPKGDLLLWSSFFLEDKKWSKKRTLVPAPDGPRAGYHRSSCPTPR